MLFLSGKATCATSKSVINAEDRFHNITEQVASTSEVVKFNDSNSKHFSIFVSVSIVGKILYITKGSK